MKSWISSILPKDEYKEKKMLYFLAEGGIILLLSLIIAVFCNMYFQIHEGFLLLLPIAVFLFYVTTRYIASGIEYTDIVTEHAYKREIKTIGTRTISFVVTFFLLYILVDGVPNNLDGWLTIVGLLLIISFLWFFTSFLSLNRSYKKNKELL